MISSNKASRRFSLSFLESLTPSITIWHSGFLPPQLLEKAGLLAMNRADLGHMGEAVAAKYYIRQGYLLLNHNYRTRMGELDLILYRADTIVFAEVKTRTSAQRAAPAEAVDYYKQQRLIAAEGFPIFQLCLGERGGNEQAAVRCQTAENGLRRRNDGVGIACALELHNQTPYIFFISIKPFRTERPVFSSTAKIGCTSCFAVSKTAQNRPRIIRWQKHPGCSGPAFWLAF